MKKFIKIILVIVVAFYLFKVPSIVRRFYPLKYSESIYKYADKYEVDPYLIAAIIRTESNFNPGAVSSKDARGLMQIMPETGEWISMKMEIKDHSEEKLFIPDYNINMGCWYISDLLKEFGNLELAVASYNGGKGNVQKWLKDTKYSKDGETLSYIPFTETDKYVKKVKVSYNIYKFLYGR